MVSTVSPKGEAHLLVYQLKLSSASHEYSAGLNKTLKKFTSKPITQVGVAGGKAERVCWGGVGRVWWVWLEYHITLQFFLSEVSHAK